MPSPTLLPGRVRHIFLPGVLSREVWRIPCCILITDQAEVDEP